MIDTGLMAPTSVEPAVRVMALPVTSGVALNVKALPAVVVWLVLSTVARTSGVPRIPDSPRGITKSNTAFSRVTELVAETFVLELSVVTEPTLIVAAVPVGPVAPVALYIYAKYDFRSHFLIERDGRLSLKYKS